MLLRRPRPAPGSSRHIFSTGMVHGSTQSVTFADLNRPFSSTTLHGRPATPGAQAYGMWLATACGSWPTRFFGTSSSSAPLTPLSMVSRSTPRKAGLAMTTSRS